MIQLFIIAKNNFKENMEYQNIILEKEDRIVTITINRPKALNALNQGVLNELDHFFQNEADISQIDGVIITGAGERAFVAGADIKEFSGLTREIAMERGSNVHDIYFSIENFQRPVIAAVNGFALGGGCELAMACHMRVAGNKARFGQPEVNLGIIPGYGGTQRLVQLIGKAKALELMMTTEMIDAETALRLGLANHVVPHGEEIEKAKELIKTIGTKSPLAISEVIKCVNTYFDKNANGYTQEIASFSELSITEDFKEGAAAFVEKRKANWKGK